MDWAFHVDTIPNRACNRLYWSPAGNYILLAGLGVGYGIRFEVVVAARETGVLGRFCAYVAERAGAFQVDAMRARSG